MSMSDTEKDQEAYELKMEAEHANGAHDLPDAECPTCQRQADEEER